MSAEAVIFYCFAVLAVVSAVAMVAFVRNIVAGVMSLVVTMISLAGVYVLLEAYLVAVIQIIVYAGAILVLFLFVIMLLNLRSDDFGALGPGAFLNKVLGTGLVVAMLVRVARDVSGGATHFGAAPEGYGGYRDVGMQLFTDYVVPVETAGLMMLAAIVGAVILAKRRID